jgi:hypothetical protein
MITHGISMVLMNEPESMGGFQGHYTLMTKDSELPLTGSKDEIADEIWKAVIQYF